MCHFWSGRNPKSPSEQLLLCLSVEIILECCIFRPSKLQQTTILFSPLILFVASNIKSSILPTRLIVTWLFACCVVNGINVRQGRLSIESWTLSSLDHFWDELSNHRQSLSISMSFNDASSTVCCVGGRGIIAPSLVGLPVPRFIFISTTEHFRDVSDKKRVNFPSDLKTETSLMTRTNRMSNRTSDGWLKEASEMEENSSVARVLLGASRRMPMESSSRNTFVMARWTCPMVLQV